MSNKNNDQQAPKPQDKKQNMIWKCVMALVRIGNFIFNAINYFEGGE